MSNTEHTFPSARRESTYPFHSGDCVIVRLRVGSGARVIELNDVAGSLVTMTDFVRRLVSGDKARFKDEKLDLELGEPHTDLPHHSTFDIAGTLFKFTSKISSTSRIV